MSDEVRFAVDGLDLDSNDAWGISFTPDEVNSPDFGAVVDKRVRAAAHEHAAEVERRILAGENRFELATWGGGTIRYTVPTWRREPIKRLRVEWARWKARRG